MCSACYKETSDRHIKGIAARRARIKLAYVENAGGICTRCGTSLPAKVMDFHHRDPIQKFSVVSALRGEKALDELQKCDLLCPKCHRDIHNEGKGPAIHPKDKTRKAYKAEFVRAFGSRCAICDEKHEDYIFDFHHVDEGNKLYNISEVLIKNINYQKAVNELQKCVMLCVTCHRLLHAWYIKLPENVKTGPHIPLIKRVQARRNCICKCGAIKDGGAGLCRKCHLLSIRKVERPSKEHLLSLLSTNSCVAVSKMYGVSDKAIKKWLNNAIDY